MKEDKIAIRTTADVKENLRKLTELLSAQMGTKITQTQAVEIAISETLATRMKGHAGRGLGDGTETL